MTATPGQTAADLDRRLADRGDAGKRAWWERYLKGEAAFHGAPIATVRDVVWPWYDHQLAEVADWNTCDWLCVRVLGPLIERHGEVAARTIAGWCDAAGLWRRRAAVVAFVNLVGRDEEPFPGCRQLVLDTCARNVTDPQRFAQTGVGWVLRELSTAAPGAVAVFLDRHGDTMSAEARRTASSRLPGE